MGVLTKYSTALLAFSVMLLCAAAVLIFVSVRLAQPKASPTDVSQPYFKLSVVRSPQKIRLKESFTIKASIHADAAFDKSDFDSQFFRYDGHDSKWMDYQLKIPRDAEKTDLSQVYTFELHADPNRPGVDGGTPYDVGWTLTPSHGGAFNATVVVVSRWDHTDGVHNPKYHIHTIAQRSVVVDVVPPVPWNDIIKSIAALLGSGGVVGLISAFLGRQNRGRT
jgi:hypothetical protein